eukprot:6208248-Pleurochrysis_carterae.AAC.1
MCVVYDWTTCMSEGGGRPRAPLRRVHACVGRSVGERRPHAWRAYATSGRKVCSVGTRVAGTRLLAIASPHDKSYALNSKVPTIPEWGDG